MKRSVNPLNTILSRMADVLREIRATQAAVDRAHNTF